MIRNIFYIIACSQLFSFFSLTGQEIKFKELQFMPDEATASYEKNIVFRDNMKDRNYFIYEVADNRTEKDIIGVIKKSNQVSRYYKFPMTLSSEMNNFLILSGLTTYRTDKDSVRLEIERFEYAKSVNDYIEKGSIVLTLNFYSVNNTFLYQYNLELKDKEFLANPHVAINTIRDAILNSVYVFNFISDDYQPFRYTIPEVTNYQELFNSKPVKGFYTSLAELIQNNPSIRPDFEISKEQSAEDYHKWELVFKDPLIEKQKKTFFENCIGFSDGEEIYVNALNYSIKFGFNPLLEKGRYLYFKGRGTGAMNNGTDGAGVDVGTFFMTGYLFGLAGGLVVGALSAIPADYEALIDLKSGKLYLVDEAFLDKIILTAPGVKEKYDKNPNRYEPYMKQLWIKEINKYY